LRSRRRSAPRRQPPESPAGRSRCATVTANDFQFPSRRVVGSRPISHRLIAGRRRQSKSCPCYHVIVGRPTPRHLQTRGKSWANVTRYRLPAESTLILRRRFSASV
jgi:hypothetical protein